MYRYVTCERRAQPPPARASTMASSASRLGPAFRTSVARLRPAESDVRGMPSIRSTPGRFGKLAGVRKRASRWFDVILGVPITVTLVSVVVITEWLSPIHVCVIGTLARGPLSVVTGTRTPVSSTLDRASGGSLLCGPHGCTHELNVLVNRARSLPSGRILYYR